MSKKEKTIYVGTLYRFGYNLTAVGYSEEEVKELLMEEYIKAFIEWNGTDPREDESDSRWADEGQTFYDVALEDIEFMELTPHKVEWR